MTRCYAWPLTVRAGDDLQLHVSTGHPRFGVRLLRCGASVQEVPGPAAVWDGYSRPIGRPDEAWAGPGTPCRCPRNWPTACTWRCRCPPARTARWPP